MEGDRASYETTRPINRTSATIIPIAPDNIEMIEIIPPRTPGNSAITNPIAPNKIAMIARIIPPGTLDVLKLHIAATSARIETRLNFATALFSIAMFES